MNEPFLSFALLAYNERDNIDRAARRCAEVLRECGKSFEFVLVDDGSSDGTGAMMDALAGELPCCRVIHHPRNLGIGAGIRTCYFDTKGEWSVWFPADLQADPGELPRLLGLLPQTDVLACYREAAGRQTGRVRKVISALDRLLVWVLFRMAVKDLHWIRFFRRDVLDRMNLACTTPTIDTEMLVQANQMGARILQAPLSDRARVAGIARGATLRSVAKSAVELFVLRWRTWWKARPARLGSARNASKT